MRAALGFSVFGMSGGLGSWQFRMLNTWECLVVWDA